MFSKLHFFITETWLGELLFEWAIFILGILLIVFLMGAGGVLIVVGLNITNILLGVVMLLPGLIMFVSGVIIAYFLGDFIS